MRLIRLILIGFSLVLSIAAGTVFVIRDSNFDDEWATVQNWVDHGNGYKAELGLFQPETGYYRSLASPEDDKYFGHLRWSPLGSWLLASEMGNSGGPSDVFRIHWSGTKQHIQDRRIDGFDLSKAVWSSNGQWAIVISELNNEWNVFLMRSDGVVVETLFEHLPRVFRRPAVGWLPNSQEVFVAVQPSEEVFETMIYSIDVYSQSIELVSSQHKLIDQMVASPDGEWIATIAEVPGGSHVRGIFRMQPDRHGLELLAYMTTTWVPEMWWADDGRIVVLIYSGVLQFALHSVDPSIPTPEPGSTSRPIETLLEQIEGPINIAWTQDRQRFATLIDDNSNYAVVVMNADGSGEWRYPIDARCAWHEPAWIFYDEWLDIADIGETGGCFGLLIKPYENTLHQIGEILPEGQSITSDPVQHATWLQIWSDNGSNSALRNHETGEIVDIPNNAQVIAWSKVPVRSEDGRRAFVVGLVVVGMSVLSFGLERFSRRFSSPTTAA